MVHITKNDVKKEIRKAVGKGAYDSIMEYVQNNKPSLWGKEKKESHLEDNILISIYKDMCGSGNLALFKATKSWLGNSQRSMSHNIKEIRPVLANWGSDQILRGTKTIWNKHAKLVTRNEPTKKVNLWMDSTDFALRGSLKKGKKDPYFSYKLNGKGRRYQFIFDAKSIVRGFWGGYSPKIYDSDWCEAYKQSLASDFKGGVIIADQHYHKFSTEYKAPKFVCPISMNQNPETDNVNDMARLTKEKIKRNKQIRKIRARVEHPFAIMEKKFKILSKKFADGPIQLDHLITFASGVLNTLNNK